MSTVIATYSGCDRDGGTPVLVTKKPLFRSSFGVFGRRAFPNMHSPPVSLFVMCDQLPTVFLSMSQFPYPAGWLLNDQEGKACSFTKSHSPTDPLFGYRAELGSHAMASPRKTSAINQFLSFDGLLRCLLDQQGFCMRDSSYAQREGEGINESGLHQHGL